MKRQLRGWVLSLLAALWSFSSLAAPAQVFIIRHAEEPETGNELSEQGRKRAAALVGLFTKNPTFTQHGPPSAIYAAAPKSVDGSVRSIQTVEPLAASLRQSVRASYTKKETAAIANEILRNRAFDGKSVLISWSHAWISKLAQALGVNPAPMEWDGSRYDRVWVLDFKEGKVSRFQDLPQKLFPGDTTP